MIIKAGVMCTSLCLCTIIIHTNSVAVYMCQYMLLGIACVLYNWLYVYQLWYAYIYVDTTKVYITSMLLFISYNIATSPFI